MLSDESSTSVVIPRRRVQRTRLEMPSDAGRSGDVHQERPEFALNYDSAMLAQQICKRKKLDIINTSPSITKYSVL